MLRDIINKRAGLLTLMTTVGAGCFINDPPSTSTTTTATSGATSSATSGTSASTGSADETGSMESTTSGGMTSNSSNSSADDGTTGMVEMCLYHCFRADNVNFPYSPNPVDPDGNPTGLSLSCETDSGSTVNFNQEPPLLLNMAACTPSQEAAEVVYELGICNPGPIPGNASPSWENWVQDMANTFFSNCADRLNNEYNCISDAAAGNGGNGYNELCNQYVRNPFIVNYNFASDWEIITRQDPQMRLSTFGPCDYNETLECMGGSSESSSGGGMAQEPFGDVSSLVSCNSNHTSCSYQSELLNNIFMNTSQLEDDGTQLTLLYPGDRFYPGVILKAPRPNTPTEELFTEFGFQGGDVVREFMGIELEPCCSNDVTHQLPSCTGVTCVSALDNVLDAYISFVGEDYATAKVVRNGQVLSVRTMQRE